MHYDEIHVSTDHDVHNINIIINNILSYNIQFLFPFQYIVLVCWNL